MHAPVFSDQADPRLRIFSEFGQLPRLDSIADDACEQDLPPLCPRALPEVRMRATKPLRGEGRITPILVASIQSVQSGRRSEKQMRQALLAIDVQASFSPPVWLVQGISELVGKLPTVSTLERHNEAATPFEGQLGWRPNPDDESLVPADRILIKHGYLPPPELVPYLRSLDVERVLVCGMQAETCVLAAGFQLFDAGLRPTLLRWLTIGSSLDRSGELGERLWLHHFGAMIADRNALVLAQTAPPGL